MVIPAVSIAGFTFRSPTSGPNGTKLTKKMLNSVFDLLFGLCNNKVQFDQVSMRLLHYDAAV